MAEPVSEAPRAPGGRSRKRRNPALDGYRGAALLGMMAWHAEVGIVRGGFARMTIFFVLSGFLATLSYNRVFHAGDNGHLGGFVRFWSNRARRLLPVTLVGVAMSIGYTRIWGPREMVEALPGDVIAVFTYVFNWRSIAADRRYAELHAEQFSFQHYWTLSLEEQCFIVLPLILAGAAFASRRRAHLGAVLIAVLAVVLGALPLITKPAPDTAYFGTHVRGAEFLVGVLAAMWLRNRGGSTTDDRTPTLVARLGLISLVGLTVVMFTVERSQLWLYRGGMGLFALPAAWVLLSSLDPTTAVHRLLRWRPIAILGRWAFPIYVVHWPIFQFIDHQLDWSRAVELPLMFASGIGVGAIVHYVYEKPLMESVATKADKIRPRQWVIPGKPLFGAIALASLVLVGLGLAPVARADEVATLDFDTAAEAEREKQVELNQLLEALGDTAEAGNGNEWDFAAGLGDLAAMDLTPARAAEVLERGPNDAYPDTGTRADGANRRVAMVGGSTALTFGTRLDENENPVVVSEVIDWGVGNTGLGCGLLRDIERRDSSRDQNPLYSTEFCNDWPVMWPAAAIESRLEVVGIMTGVWDTYDVQLPGSQQWQSLLDPEVDQALRGELDLAISSLEDAGVSLVVLFTTPQVTDGQAGSSRDDRGLPDDHNQRVNRYNEILADVASESKNVVVVDYAGYIDALPDDVANEWLYDGVHPTTEASDAILSEFLVGALEEAVTSCATCSWNTQ